MEKKDQRAKPNRHFGVGFKKEKVRLLEEGKVRVCELVRVYGVSRSAIYKWKELYGSLPKGERMVVEKVSAEARTLKLLDKIKELECALGRKELENTYLRAVMEQARTELGYDVEKKFNKQ